LPVQISESIVENNLGVGDRVVDVTHHSLSNISCKSNKLGINDNVENLRVDNSGKNPSYETENITVLNSCTDPRTIASSNKKTNFDTPSNEVLRRDVRQKLDFKADCDIESKIYKCTAIKRTNEHLESDCGVSELNWTLDALNNSFLKSGEIKTIEETNNYLAANYSNVITSTPIRLEVDISRQQTFTHSSQAVDFKCHKSYVDGDYSLM